MSKPPKAGSIMEAMCLMVQMRREIIEYQRVQTVVTAIRSIMPVGESVEGADMDGKTVRDALKDFRGSLMPFLKEQLKKEENHLLKALREETSRGPLQVQAISNPTVKSKLRQRAIQELSKPIVKPHWVKRRR